MWPAANGVKVYLAAGVTDLRKSIGALTVLVSEGLALDPLSGHLFVFGNRRRNQVKILYWDRNGFCLWQKRLEEGQFRWPEAADGVLSLDWRELAWLLEGLKIRQRGAHRKLAYETVY